MDLRVLPDEKLLQLLRANNEQAFKEIYTRYRKPIFDAAWHRLANRETAQELVQTIFLRIWEKRHSIHIIHLQGYLQTAIKNSVINYIEASLVHHWYELLYDHKLPLLQKTEPDNIEQERWTYIEQAGNLTAPVVVYRSKRMKRLIGTNKPTAR